MGQITAEIFETRTALANRTVIPIVSENTKQLLHCISPNSWLTKSLGSCSES